MGKEGANWQDYTDGWILLWLCWLKGGLRTARAIHLCCLRHCAPHPARLFCPYSSRGITAKKAAKQAERDYFNSSKGIKGESCTSNTATDPRGLCRKPLYGLKSCQPDQRHDYIRVSQKHCQGAWHAELTSPSICCSFAPWSSGQRDKVNESHTQDLNSGTHLEAGAGRHEVVWTQDPNEECTTSPQDPGKWKH